MKKWLKSKELQKITGLIAILCTVVLVQIATSIYFNRKIYDMSLEHTIKQVEELSQHVKRNFELELNHYTHILKIMELRLEKEDDIYSPHSMELIRETRKISGFRLIGLSDLNGNGVDSTGNRHDISYENMKETILKDQVYISNLIRNDEDVLIFIAVPLKIEGEVRGIVWGKMPLEEIANHIEMDEDSYKYFQIIDDKGNYLFLSKSKYALTKDSDVSTTTVWEQLERYSYEDRTSVEEIRQSVEQGESGNFYFEGNGEGRYVNYRPLDINNWCLFSIQVQDEMNIYVDHLRTLAAYFFLIITIGFLVVFGVIYKLIYTLYKKSKKQNQDIKTINAMLQAILEQTGNTPFIVDHPSRQVIVYNYPAKDSIKYCPFEEISPDAMLKNGIMEEDCLDEYRRMYQKVVVEGKEGGPIVIYCRRGNKKEWLRASIIANVETEQGQMIGVLEGYSEQKEKDKQIQMHLDDIRKIEQRSQKDFLTQLYNRETFMAKMQIALEESCRNREVGAFIILDLDHFKEVNDTMGHSMGDVVLKETADTLLGFFRKEDIVGRLGGDEFVVFAKNIKNVFAFEERIRNLNNLMRKIYEKDGEQVQVSASIGIVLTNIDHPHNFAILYEQADQALYLVKELGRDGFQIYAE